MPKVLVVDDSVSVRKVIERALEARRIDVISAALGSEAIERIEREEPDVVVSDVILPDKDGYQVCEFVKTHPRLGRTPVLLISGIVNDSVLERAARVHSDEVIRKPFVADELARKIEALFPIPDQNGHGPPLPDFAPPILVPAAVAATATRETPTPVPAAPEPPAADAPVPSLKTYLDQLTAIAGVRLAVLANREGFLIESTGEAGGEAEIAGALASCLAEASDGLGRELGQGPLHGIILEYEGGMVLVHGVGPEALLAIVLRDAAVLGKVRYYAKKTLPELVRIL